ncbi:MAG TPA: hypothetical protein VGS13_14775 [Stellaceae bacterium]|nr:hypothetical protein [Stellaceae bacterium]
MNEGDELARARARLAEIDRELERLQAQHDLAMSRFRFDEANALQRRIGRLDDERRAVGAALPPLKLTAEAPRGGVPIKIPPRQALRARRRR